VENTYRAGGKSRITRKPLPGGKGLGETARRYFLG
jgi:hypothetical protein